MPTLDFQMRLNYSDKTTTGMTEDDVDSKCDDIDNVISYIFYKKPMASKLTILYQSALSVNIKSNTIVQESLRRLYHISSDISQSGINNILEEYIQELSSSGYPEDLIRKHLLSAIVGFERKLERVKNGEQQMHRSGVKIKSNTRYKKLNDEDSWYNKRTKYDERSSYVSKSLKTWGSKKVNVSAGKTPPTCAPLFVPRTNNGKLAELIRSQERVFNQHSKVKPLARSRLWKERLPSLQPGRGRQLLC